MTYEQGENIHVEGSLQQRKFTPADGITRTVHEVHVKACHVIAASSIGPGSSRRTNLHRIRGDQT